MYCSKCGNEINENATFCGNCGNKINVSRKTNNRLETIKSFDFKKVLNAIKEYLLHFYVDYNSKLFKFAMILFLAIGIGTPFYEIVSYILPFNIYELFTGASAVFEVLTCALLFGIFSIFILKSKQRETVKKSNFLRIFWVVSLALNVSIFFASSDGLGLMRYILYSNIAEWIVELSLAVSTALLIYKNKPKYPIALLISLLSFVLPKISLLWIETDFLIYNLQKEARYFFEILATDSLGYILLGIVLFALVYLVPKKISKWLVLIPALLVVVLEIMDLIKAFSIVNICSFVINTFIVVMFVLFALSCGRKVEYNYIVENQGKIQKDALKVGIISVVSTAVIIITCLLSSAIVCASQINSGIQKWKNQIVNGELTTAEQWSLVRQDVFNPCDKFAAQFIDEYSLYKTLDENWCTMERISECFSAYQSGKVDNDIIEKYSNIKMNESWKNDSVLSIYYKKYMAMQPDINNVSVSGYVSVENGEIKITVKNKNEMPISKCTVNCKFTILFIEPGTYSDNEYGRGSKTIVVENIDGGSSKTETISFDPDEYYDSYGSYILATLWDHSIEIISIE